MRGILRIIAAVILTTGSISSTSGTSAAEAGCALPGRGSAVELINGLSIAPGAPVRFEEQVFHPALTAPETTRGIMRIADDGDLVREDTWPAPASFRIGEDFLTERLGEGGEPNLLPIPSEMQPFLQAIRALMGGDVDALRRAFDLDLVNGGAPGTVRLLPRLPGTGMVLVLRICGPRLLAIEIEQEDGIRRVLSFGPPE